MVNKIKRLNKIQIVSIIGLIISLVLILFNVKGIYNWFWIFTGIGILGIVKFIDKWCIEGRTWFRMFDKKYDKNLTRKSSELLFFILVAYVLVICMFFIIEFWKPAITKDLSVIIGVFIATIVYHIILLLVVDKTSKQVIDIAENKIKGKIGMDD